jgi:hypothetical protein
MLFKTRRNKVGQETESDTDEHKNRKIADKITRNGLINGEKYSQEQLDSFKSSIKDNFRHKKLIMNPNLA